MQTSGCVCHFFVSNTYSFCQKYGQHHKMVCRDFEISNLMRTFALIGKIVNFNAYP